MAAVARRSGLGAGEGGAHGGAPVAGGGARRGLLGRSASMSLSYLAVGEDDPHGFGVGAGAGARHPYGAEEVEVAARCVALAERACGGGNEVGLEDVLAAVAEAVAEVGAGEEEETKEALEGRVRRVILAAGLRGEGAWRSKVEGVGLEVAERGRWEASEAARRADEVGGRNGEPLLADVPLDVAHEVARSASLRRIGARLAAVEAGEEVPSHGAAHVFLAWARSGLYEAALRRAREAALENWNIAVGFAEYRMCVRTLYTWKVHLLERRSMRVAATDARLIKMAHMCFMSMRMHTGRRREAMDKVRRALGHSTRKIFASCFRHWCRVRRHGAVQEAKIGEALGLRRRLMLARLRGGVRQAIAARAAVRRAVNVWQGNLLAKAWARWAREAAELARLGALARGALARLRSRDATLAWNRLRDHAARRKWGRAAVLEAVRVWHFHLGVSALRGWAAGVEAQVEARARAQVVVRRIQGRAALAALARLREHAAGRARLRGAARRWKRVELARAFGAWVDAVGAWEERRARAARALAHWSAGALSASYRTLEAHAAGRRRVRRAARAWKGAALGRALRRWIEFVDERAALREVGLRVVMRLARGRQAACLRALGEFARGQGDARRAVARWRGASLARAFAAWVAHASWAVAAAESARVALVRWEGRLRLAAFRRLRDQARASAGLRAALAHWREGELGRAFGTWVEAVAEAHAAREAQLRALTLWQHATQGRFLARLRDFTWTQRALRRALTSWNRGALARAFRGWTDELARRVRGEALAAQAVVRMREALLWRCLGTLLEAAVRGRDAREKKASADGHWHIFSKSRAFREWRLCARGRRELLLRMEQTLELMDVLRKRRSLAEWRSKHAFITHGRRAVSEALHKREARWKGAAWRTLMEHRAERRDRQAKVAGHLTVTRLLRCWKAWGAAAARTHALRVVQALAIRRMGTVKQRAALATWAAFAERRAWAKGILAEAATIRGRRTRRVALSLLRARVPQVRRKREITQAAVDSLYLRLLKAAFRRWAAAYAEMRAAREAVVASVGFWARKTLERGVRAWREALVEIRTLRDLSDVAGSHRDSRLSAACWVKLRSAVERGRQRRRADAVGEKVAELHRAGALGLCYALWKRERVAVRHSRLRTTFRLFWRWHAFAGWQQQRRESYAVAIFQFETSAAQRALRGWVMYLREREEHREELARAALEKRRRHTLMKRAMRRVRLVHLRVALGDLRRHALIASVVRTRAELATARMLRQAVVEWYAFCAARAVMRRKLARLLRILGSRIAREVVTAWFEAAQAAKAALAEDYAAARGWRKGVLRRQAMRVWVAHLAGGAETKKSALERAEQERLALAVRHREERLAHFALVGWRLHLKATHVWSCT